MEKYTIIYNQSLRRLKYKSYFRMIEITAFFLMFFIFQGCSYVAYYLIGGKDIATRSQELFTRCTTVGLIAFLIVLTILLFALQNKNEAEHQKELFRNMYNEMVFLQAMILNGATLELITPRVIKVSKDNKAYNIALMDGILDIENHTLDFTKIEDKYNV